MRKFCPLFLIFIFCLSCTSDSSEPQVNPNLLQRVDFYPGTVGERRWFFNTDGLLIQITKSDGTIVENFTYDTHNRLTGSTVFNDGGTNEIHTFTYDNNNFVASVYGETVHYDSTLAAYYTGDLSAAYRLTKLNSDKLLLQGKTVVMDNDESGINETDWFEISIGYTNNNITSFSPEDHCNSLTHDTKVNPLRNATLAICRAFAFIPNSHWVSDYCVSANNTLTHDYCSEDPESEVFHFTYNPTDLPLEQTHDSYYFGVYENTRVSAKYYYQGDVLP